ncbi:MAG: hypothetical protein HYV28_01915 [Ignavibacteriales bacterium]|nr:hypothetical protein [Ignavibacteriales bacterium]
MHWYYPTIIIHSNLIGFFIKYYFNETNDDFPQIKVSQLKSLPIPKVDLTISKDQIVYDEIVRNVESLLPLNKEKQAAKLQTQIQQLQSRIDFHEEKINNAVYKLYRLTDEEICIIKGGIK